MASTITAQKLLPAPRITSIDLLRGVVMILMALDHVRDYFHQDANYYAPLDLSQTNTALFLTRWITHFCAPVFMMLAGTSAFLVRERKGIKYTSRFLLTRGLFLVFLELTVVNFGWYFNINFSEFPLIVIWALGVSMIALSAMIYLPWKAILIIGIILVAGHNLLDNVTVEGDSFKAFAWSLLHDDNFFHYGNKNIFVGYPLIPWIGIIALGYSLGRLYSSSVDPGKRKKILIWLGVGAILLFIILRFPNLYGDPLHWSRQAKPHFTILSFIHTLKYPPSLLYTLMTLGPACLFLAFFENVRSALVNIISVFGRVPMFYYLIHIYLVHFLAMLAAVYSGYDWTLMVWDTWADPKVTGFGFSLGITYLVWIGVIIILYPLCKWYDSYKQRHKEKRWLSYL